MPASRRKNSTDTVSADNLACPECGHQFELSAALLLQVAAPVRAEYETKLRGRELEHEKALEAQKDALAAEQMQKATEAVTVKLTALEEDLAATKSSLNDARATELELLRQRRALDDEKQCFELDKAKQIEAERAQIRNDAAQEAKADLDILREQLDEKTIKLTEAKKLEAILLQERRALVEEREAFEIDKAKQIEAERAQIRTRAIEESAVELTVMRERLDEKDAKLAEARKQETILVKERRALVEEREAFELDKAKQIETERRQIRAQAIEESGAELTVLRERLDEKEAKLAEARKQETVLLQERRALVEEREAFELDKLRQVEAERAAIKDDASRQADERHRLKEAEWNRQREAMGKQIDDLRRKAEQGSQELQGEVQELDIEANLAATFPFDTVEPVSKGKRGADVLQRVRDKAAQDCGAILWESKRARNWSSDWLPKLRDDQRAAKADIAVLVTEVLPKGVTTFGHVDGVWVTSPECVLALAAVLRTTLLEVASATRSLQGRQTKTELLYRYMSGPEFRQRVDGIVEAFGTMSNDLSQERAVMERHWAKREKQLTRAIASASGLYGDLQGIVGSGFPELKALELKLLVANDNTHSEDDTKGGAARTPADGILS